MNTLVHFSGAVMCTGSLPLHTYERPCLHYSPLHTIVDDGVSTILTSHWPQDYYVILRSSGWLRLHISNCSQPVGWQCCPQFIIFHCSLCISFSPSFWFSHFPWRLYPDVISYVIYAWCFPWVAFSYVIYDWRFPWVALNMELPAREAKSSPLVHNSDCLMWHRCCHLSRNELLSPLGALPPLLIQFASWLENLVKFTWAQSQDRMRLESVNRLRFHCQWFSGVPPGQYLNDNRKLTRG